MNVTPKVCGDNKVFVSDKNPCEGGGCRLQDKTTTENGLIVPDNGYDGLSSVLVQVPQPSGTIDITQNGTVDVTQYSTAHVNVIYGLRSPHTFGTGTFYLTALMGEATQELEYYDPDTEQMYTVTLPNDLNVMQWDNTAVEVSA